MGAVILGMVHITMNFSSMIQNTPGYRLRARLRDRCWRTEQDEQGTGSGSRTLESSAISIRQFLASLSKEKTKAGYGARTTH